MADQVTITVNGVPVAVPPGTMVSAAVALSGVHVFRRSITGEPRGPVCGMGICFECRVTVNGRPHQRSCMVECSEGLRVETDE